MKAAPPVLSLLLILLSHSGWTNALCNLENGTVARCHELEDVKYIETYDLESLKASVIEKVLGPGLFNNLSSLRHLDLSGGDLELVEPGSFRKLVNLRSLDLADNRIGYLELGALDGLNHLRSLNLRKNNLQQLPPALARLKILRHLDVQGNPLQCNCATLRVRDLIVKRGVKMTKKILCAGPNNMKGTPLLTPDTTVICTLEDQDREMQKDQAFEGSGGEGSGDIFDELEEDDEYVEIHNNPSETPKEPELETPAPETSVTPTTTTTTMETTQTQQDSLTIVEVTTSSTTPVDVIMKTTEEEDEIFFDRDDKKEQTATISQPEGKKEDFKDSLFYPVEGSGDEEDGSGEGSGTFPIFTDLMTPDEDTRGKGSTEESTSTGGSDIFDFFYNVLFATTASPEDEQDPDLTGEQFIDVSSTKEPIEDVIIPQKARVDESAPSVTPTTIKSNLFSPTSAIELLDDKVDDSSALGKVKEADDTVNDELAEVSPTKQSKKGMGSYVALATLLAILVTLIAFAAYKGDFCRKKRKRGDVENGTELKDMQKALLEAGNSTQPRITSNGNAESVPLVEGAPEHEDLKDRRHTADVPRTSNGTPDAGDPVKPPRRTATPQSMEKTDESSRPGSLKEDSLPSRTSPVEPPVTGIPTNNGPMSRLPEPNGPPLSPGAQRVKITLQENPDSIPRTPILITRTMAGENLVKTP